jgi:hypothetical protein
LARPDFLIIGAMKCGTSTLAAQLAAQPGVFMTTPKEPNFFSDDAIHARGLDWYESLFAAARPEDLKGEASTHYTKLPTHPDTVARLAAAVPAPKLIYMIRNPMARAVSHYIHEWTMGVMEGDIAAAVSAHPELVDYGRYGHQIAPYVARFGRERILLTSLEAMEAAPQAVLEQVWAFLGASGRPVWQQERARENASAERIRRFPLHGLVFDNPVARTLRRRLVPQAIRDRIKRRRQMTARPELPEPLERQLRAVFAEDFAALAALFPDRPDLRRSYPFLDP